MCGIRRRRCDDRKPSMVGCRQEIIESLYGVTLVRIQTHQLIHAGHDIRDRDIRGWPIVFVIQVRIPLKLNPRFIDAVPGKDIPNPFREHHGYHNRKHICQRPRQLKHDHDDRHGHASDSCKSRCSSNDSICSRSYARNVRFAGSKDHGGSVMLLEELDNDTKRPPKECTDCQRWQHDACWNLQTKCDRRQKKAKSCSGEEQSYNRYRPSCCNLAQAEYVVIANACTFSEEVVDQLGQLCSHEQVGKVDESSNNSDKDYLRDRPPKEWIMRRLSEPGHQHIEFDKQTAVETSDNAKNGKGHNFEAMP